jgi:hypothetical protein
LRVPTFFQPLLEIFQLGAICETETNLTETFIGFFDNFYFYFKRKQKQCERGPAISTVARNRRQFRVASLATNMPDARLPDSRVPIANASKINNCKSSTVAEVEARRRPAS